MAGKKCKVPAGKQGAQLSGVKKKRILAAPKGLKKPK